MLSLPLVISTFSGAHKQAPFTGLADQLQQTLQWHINCAMGSPLTVTSTLPQKHAPL